MTTYRVTRTIVDGQFANDKCFTNWLESFGPMGTGKAWLVDMRIDPVSTLGPVSVVPSSVGDVGWAVLAPPIYVGGKIVQAIGQKAADVPKAQQRRYYLWAQEATLGVEDTAPLLKCKSDPDLIGSGGKNGWPTEAEARKVLDAQLAGSAAVVSQVKAANAKAVSAGNVASGAVDDLAKDAAKAVEGATGVSAKFIGPIAGAAAAALGLYAGYQVVQALRGK